MERERKHPPGLPVLFFTEMWERFGFYLIIGIFFLYMTDKEKGGLGLEPKEASDIFGTYIALVYLTPFLGGLMADRYLGYRLTIYIGGFLMALGYLGLALPGWPAFYLSLLLIIFGNGFFKPNISTLLGNLYSDERYRPHKDAGYNIFYMGINIGAFVCNFVAAYVRNAYGWSYAFATAGVGMLIGLLIFKIGESKVKEADVRKPSRPEDMPMLYIIGSVFAPAAVFGVIGWFVPSLLFGPKFTLFGSKTTDAFLFACIPVVVFYVALWVRASREDRSPIGALLAIFGVVIIFWAVFHQNGTALTIWAESFTDRQPSAAVRLLTDRFSEFAEDAPPSYFANAGPEVPRPARETYEVVSKERYKELEEAKQLGIKEGKKVYVTQEMLDKAKVYDRAAETTPTLEPLKHLKLINTELLQSVNPFWVVVLTPVVVGFFNFLRTKGMEPSTPAKIGYGLIISALSSLVMVGAVYATLNGHDKASLWWLVGAYFVVTIGELCLSPMGLSLVSKVSPARLTALMMGGWFLSTSIGNKLSGVLAGMWGGYENKANFFYVNMALCLVAGLAIFAMVPWLRRVVKQRTGMD